MWNSPGGKIPNTSKMNDLEAVQQDIVALERESMCLV